jgi:hypothetical protein
MQGRITLPRPQRVLGSSFAVTYLHDAGPLAYFDNVKLRGAEKVITLFCSQSPIQLSLSALHIYA